MGMLKEVKDLQGSIRKINGKNGNKMKLNTVFKQRSFELKKSEELDPNWAFNDDLTVYFLSIMFSENFLAPWIFQLKF